MRFHSGAFLLGVAIVVAGVFAAPQTIARDTKNMWPITDAMNSGSAKARLDAGIKFYFGDSEHPPVAKSFGVFMSNKKTNGVGRKDKEACEWTFLSAMISFQDRAKQLGGDAVINIESYYRKNTIKSATEYECGSGGLMSGVTFRGEVVKLQ
jgi:hypothetical protein